MELEFFSQITGTKSGTLTAYSSYQHAVKNINIAIAKTVTSSLGSGGLGGVINLTNPYPGYYDAMQGVYTSW